MKRGKQTVAKEGGKQWVKQNGCVSQQEEHKYINYKKPVSCCEAIWKKIGFSQPTDVNVFLISCWYKSEVHEICQNTKANRNTGSQKNQEHKFLSLTAHR